MTRPTIGLLHPGQMGASVGAAAISTGHRVVWASEGRSEATRARAAAAGLEDAATLAAFIRESDVVLSVCPPHAADDLAREVVAGGFRGLFVDANAVSPATARAIETIVTAQGAAFVDGGIIGPPAWRAGTTRLYVSGARAGEVAAIFAGSPLDARVVDGGAGSASALKMAYAAYTKGTSALVANILALAEREGVSGALRDEWAISQPDLARSADARLGGAAPKAWRWVAEMEEIAATFEAAGLPGGVHRAAAEVYRRLAGFKDAEAPAVDAVIEALLAARGARA